MRSSARVCASSIVAVVTMVLALSACGSTRPQMTQTSASLCIDVGLPTSGPEEAASALVMKGIDAAIPPEGIDFDGYGIHVCRGGYAGTGGSANATEHLLDNAVAAAADTRTIAYIGGLSGTEAQDADAVLAPAGIPMITPSSESAVAAVTRRSGGPAGPQTRQTAFYLLPSATGQIEAETAVVHARGCLSLVSGIASTSQRPPRCLLTAGLLSSFCADVPVLSSPYPELCVVAGEDISPAEQPAVAYGEGAAELLLSTLKRIAAAGGDIADRTVVFDGIGGADLSTSPIGPIRFEPTGEIAADHYSVYSVRRGGQLVPSETFTTH